MTSETFSPPWWGGMTSGTVWVAGVLLCNLFTPWRFRKQRQLDQRVGGANTLQAQFRDPCPPGGFPAKVTSSWESCMCSSTQTSWGLSQIQVTLGSLNKTLTIQQRKHFLPLISIAQLHTDCRQNRAASILPPHCRKTNLPLGGSPLLHPFKGHSSDHSVCNSRFYQRRNSIFFMEKSLFFFSFSI